MLEDACQEDTAEQNYWGHGESSLEGVTVSQYNLIEISLSLTCTHRETVKTSSVVPKSQLALTSSCQL